MTDTKSPTVVLVHGAFADAGSWAGVEGSHLVMVSQPQAVADVILKALKAVG